jgi:hypothetical protein
MADEGKPAARTSRARAGIMSGATDRAQRRRSRYLTFIVIQPGPVFGLQPVPRLAMFQPWSLLTPVDSPA